MGQPQGSRQIVFAAGEGRKLSVLGDSATCKASLEQTAGAWELFEIDAPPGSAVPLHRHPWTEAYYILSGQVEFQIGERTTSLGPGAFVNVAPGTPHTLRNGSSAHCRYLLWVAPAGHVSSFFGELDAVGRSGPPALETILGIAGKHRIELVPT